MMNPEGTPWQVLWKHPEWNQSSPSSNTATTTSDGTPPNKDRLVVGSTSAQIDPSELPLYLQHEISKEESSSSRSSSSSSSRSSSSILLSVTLLSRERKSSSSEATNVASEMILELYRLPSGSKANENTETSRNNNVLLASSRLQWPEAVFAPFHQEEEDPEDNEEEEIKRTPQKENIFSSLQEWITLSPLMRKLDKKKKSETSLLNKHETSATNGLISAIFLRRTTDDGKTPSTADALDTIALMSLGMEVPTSPSPATVAAAAAAQDALRISSDRNDGHTKEIQSTPPDLYLACMTAQGLITIYSPWTLLNLQEETDGSSSTIPKKNAEEEFMDGLATLFLGQEIFSTLEQAYKPLSEPLSTISLSILEQNQVYKQRRRKRRALDVSLWNHLVESATIPHRTVANRVTNLAVAGTSYLVVFGSGIPYTQVFRHDDDSSLGGDHKHHQEPQDDWWDNQEQDNHDPIVPQEAMTPSDEEVRSRINSNGSEWFQDGAISPVKSVLRADSHDSWYQEDTATENDDKLQTPKDGKNNQSWWSDDDGRPDARSKTKSGSHWWDGIKNNGRQDGDDELPVNLSTGGFVTFCAISQWSETRTLFMPFAPKQVSYIPQWNSMELLLVLGETQAMAIRMDSSPHPVAIGATTDQLHSSILEATSAEEEMRAPSPNTTSINENFIWIKRFQVMPIPFPQTSVKGRMLCGSAMGVHPPALLQLFTEETHHGLVLQKSLKGITSLGTIEVEHAPCHVAKIRVQEQESLQSTWSLLGQGWSILGTNQRVYFICWEGATAARGVAFVQELDASPNLSSHVVANIDFVLPVFPSTPKEPSTMGMQFPFSEPYDTSRLADREEEKEDVDGIVSDALESISGLSYLSQSDDDRLGVPVSMLLSPRSETLSHREKSIRLLSQCSSWTRLEHTLDKMKRQVPVVNLQFGNLSTPRYTLTLRQMVVDNGPASPFQQVLSWLVENEDYFTAASIALDLLKDAESLCHLWKNADKIDEVDQQIKLEGLLDGVVPIREGFPEDNHTATATLVQLADMTVACLTKGGFPMSTTLQKFLRNNEYYDPSRACLMLVATTASALSEDPNSVSVVMRNDPRNPSFDNLLWPLRCLLEIGVTRGYLSTALLLLNSTIPDELRRRPIQYPNSLTVPAMDLTERLVASIIACDGGAAELLLNLVDDISRCRYWQSLDHGTRLVLSLIDIERKYPLLRHIEVRSWAREQLHKCLRSEKSADVNVSDIMPTDWLRKLCVACLQNACCAVNNFEIHKAPPEPAAATRELNSEDGLEEHKAEILNVRNALVSSPGSGGVDFDLLIPCLLLLQIRGIHWNDDNYVSTQSILDATCYLAGRHTTNDEPAFVFDGRSVMRQCALAGNVGAGANLIGGKNGFVLSCCDILINELGTDMDDTEAFFLSDSLSPGIVQTACNSAPFEIGDAHRQLLWLLDEHVLIVKTFGEFDTRHIRGKVDPVFCSRSILRAWLCLSYGDKRNGVNWLINYLRRRLDMCDGLRPSPHRLPCAALCRALFWSADGTTNLLCAQLDMDMTFLVQLALSCCGLVESVPPAVAEEMRRKSDVPTSTTIPGVSFPTSNILV